MAKHVIIPALWQTEEEREKYVATMKIFCGLSLSRCTRPTSASEIHFQIGDMHFHQHKHPIMARVFRNTDIPDATILKQLGRALRVECIFIRCDNLAAQIVCSTFRDATNVQFYGVNTDIIADHMAKTCAVKKLYVHSNNLDMARLVTSLVGNEIGSLEIYCDHVTNAHALISYLASRSFDRLTLRVTNIDSIMLPLVDTAFYANTFETSDYGKSLDSLNVSDMTLTRANISDSFWHNTLRSLTISCLHRYSLSALTSWIQTNHTLESLTLHDIPGDTLNAILHTATHNSNLTNLMLPTGDACDANTLSRLLYHNTTLTRLGVGELTIAELKTCLRYTSQASAITYFGYGFMDDHDDEIADAMTIIAQCTNIIRADSCKCIENTNLRKNKRKLLDICLEKATHELLF